MTRYHRINENERRPYTASEEASADILEVEFNSTVEVDKRHNAAVDLDRVAGYATDGDNFDALWKAIDALRQGQGVPDEVTDMLSRRAAVKTANPKR